MVRYLGYLLVALMALALAGGVGLILFGGMAERLATPGAVRLVAFDQVVGAGAGLRLRAFLEDMDYGHPINGVWLIARLPGGWAQPLPTDDRGLAEGDRPEGLPEGTHDLTVAYPETHPRLDVVAHGTIWVLPLDQRVVWIDASVVVSPNDKDEVSSDAVAAIKAIAAARQPVYLVTARAEQYGAVRRRLTECGAPGGPAVWVGAGNLPRELERVRRAAPNIDGAVLGRGDLVLAVAPLNVPMLQVPSVGAAEAPVAGVMTWRDAVEKWSSLAGGLKPSPGGTK
jgi:hypothetical protein